MKTDIRLVSEWLEPTSIIQTRNGDVTAAAWCKAEAARVPWWQVVTHPETHEIAVAWKDEQ
jgi:hypothetical protein